MRQRTKSILIYLPKVIIFGLAFLNFLYIQSHIPNKIGLGISFCYSCPWYETSDFIYVPVILAASIFLLISKPVSYFIAVALSGYIVVIATIHLIFRSMSLFERWELIQKYELNFLLTIETQWLLAGIVFIYTIFYLIRDVFYRNAFQNRLI
jgi:hypothetical protein